MLAVLKNWPRRLFLVVAGAAFMAGGSLAVRWLDDAPDTAGGRLSLMQEQTDRLSRAAALSHERVWLKEQLARDLAAGRVSLAEAIRRARALADEESRALPPGLPQGVATGRDVLRGMPGRSEEERCGRNLLRWVAAVLRESPMRAEVVARLERELEELTGKRQASPCSPSP
jgi:hypothetical protein